MNEDQAVVALSALAHSMRLRIFRSLVVAGQEGMTPGAMVEALSLPNATLSFHLKELSHAGLVSSERMSRHLVYRAAFDRMNGLLGFLTENCCGGTSCSVSASVCDR